MLGTEPHGQYEWQTHCGLLALAFPKSAGSFWLLPRINSNPATAGAPWRFMYLDAVQVK